MTWPEVRERLEESCIAILCIGSTEAHGLHLPLDVDTFNVYEIAKRAAERVADEVKPVLVPPIPFGYNTSEVLNNFPCISISSTTLKQLIKEVCVSLVRIGFRKLVLIPGHGLNPPATQIAIWELTDEYPNIYAVRIDWFLGFGGDIIRKVLETPFNHAGEMETSVYLALGGQVDMEKAKKVEPVSPSKYVSLEAYAPEPTVMAVGKPMEWYKLSQGIGGVYDPTKASKEKGREIVDNIVDRLSDFLIELKTIQL